ncbi:MAG TPA: DnaB-like helicase C-terminal domain-containing protein [Minicystis sp.]|nr:DnaB-like helicase C-terminal domain-containing protein [Minicystis sp.]
MPATRWRAFRASALRYLGLADIADPKCCNEARIYFAPTRHPDGHAARVVSHDGAPLRVDAIDAWAAEHPECEPLTAQAPERRPLRVEAPRAAVRSRDAIVKYLATIEPAIQGSHGSDPTFRAAQVLVHKFELDDACALELLLTEYNPRCQPPWSRRELEHKVKSARQKGRMPRGIEDREPPRREDDDVERAAIQSEPEIASAAWPTLSELAFELVGLGDPLPTGIAPFDAACRGGLRPNRRIVLAGAPGAGKTSLAMMLAVGWAREAVQVAVMAYDEAAIGLVVRAAQHVGLDRDRLEAADPETLTRFAEVARAELRTLHVLDAPRLGVAIPDVARELARRAEHGPAVLVLDSIQATARAPRYAQLDSIRARVDAVMADLAAAGSNVIVLATSEVGRAFYDGRAVNAGVSGLASAKESGGVEYAADIVVTLASVAGEHGDVDLTIEKNRTGRIATWRMRFDHARASLACVAAPTVPSHDAKSQARDEAEQRAVEALARRLPAIVAKGRCSSKDALRAELGGRRARAQDAIALAEARGWIVPPAKQRDPYRVGSSAPSNESAESAQSAHVGPESSRGRLSAVGPVGPTPLRGGRLDGPTRDVGDEGWGIDERGRLPGTSEGAAAE